ncbi:hypothetical protein OAI93_01470 [bacterium]|nr:hypothetical protein [bacterium]
MFCKECGKEIKKNAVICIGCGIAIKSNEIKSNEKPHMSIPIISMITGVLGLFTFLDDSPWDYETLIGCLILYSMPSIILGIISIARNHDKKELGIAGLIMGIISFLVYMDMLLMMS